MILLGKNPGIHSPKMYECRCWRFKRRCHRLYGNGRPKTRWYCIYHRFRTPLGSDIADNSSESSSTASFETPNIQHISENDGLVYLLDYLAKKHLKENPEFGCYTHQSNESLNLHSYVLPSWIQSLSFGGLIPPSQICITKVRKNE
jgi:hypothetical protein